MPPLAPFAWSGTRGDVTKGGRERQREGRRNKGREGGREERQREGGSMHTQVRNES